jgi:hypothetical protein
MTTRRHFEDRDTDNQTRAASINPLRGSAAVPRGDGGHPTDRTRALALEKRLTIRLDADRLEELEDYAFREGFTVSVIVRHLICRFIEDQRRYCGGRKP